MPVIPQDQRKTLIALLPPDLLSNGRIEAIGFDSVVRAGYDADSFDRVIDAGGKCILPGKSCLRRMQVLALCTEHNSFRIVNNVKFF